MSDLRVYYGDLDLTDVPFLIEFSPDFGAPQLVTEALALMLQDGEVELSERASNRTFGFNVLIEDVDLGALADHEAALVAECRKERNTLTIDPGDYGPPTVFDTFRTSPVYQRDEDLERQRMRRYGLTIKAAPYGRSVNEVTTEALAIGSSTVSIADGSSATNWSSSAGAVSSSGGMVQVSSSTPFSYVPLVYTAAVDMSAHPYVFVDWVVTGADSATFLFRAFANSTELTRIGSVPLTDGKVRAYYDCPIAAVTSLRFEAWVSPFVGGAVSATFKIDQLSKTDVPPTLGTTRQLLRSLPVRGSARTQGRLTVGHESDALGEAFVYTFADEGRGYVPALRPVLSSSGTVTSDSTLMSGARNVLASQSWYDIPTFTLPPGLYVLIVRARKNSGTADQTFTVTTRTMIDGNDADAFVSFSVTHNMDSTWRNYVLGTAVLPTCDVGDGRQAICRITLADADLTDDIDVDELWAFNLDVGALTWVDCGDGSPGAGVDSSHLFILPPTLDYPRPRVLRGSVDDMSDAAYAGGSGELYSWGDHEAVPPAVTLFTGCTNAEAVAAAFHHFPRWYSFAAE